MERRAGTSSPFGNYRRAIEIYTTRTTPAHIHGSEFNSIHSPPPLRLHFRGLHYNSIASATQETFVEDEAEVGKIEDIAIRTSKILQESKYQAQVDKKKDPKLEDIALKQGLEESLQMEKLRSKTRLLIQQSRLQSLKLSESNLKNNCGRTDTGSGS